MQDHIIKDSKGKGKGLFSTVNIPANQVILQFVGKQLLRENISDFSGDIATGYLQIGSELYLDLAGQHSYFLNHSCNGNCGIRIAANNAFLVSIRDIRAGDEMTYDYSTTSTEDASTWSMKCACSVFYCRGKITGWSSVPKDIQDKYMEAGMVPDYVNAH